MREYVFAFMCMRPCSHVCNCAYIFRYLFALVLSLSPYRYNDKRPRRNFYYVTYSEFVSLCRPAAVFLEWILHLTSTWKALSAFMSRPGYIYMYISTCHMVFPRRAHPRQSWIGHVFTYWGSQNDSSMVTSQVNLLIQLVVYFSLI